ncbi:acetyl-CoA C-acetyltransferase [Microbulbifer donghaiensis]|uniref:acetyl-CoA C-acyltransferase n=1 Tax=Microbulbifer donghaiensis TaxID=494016 RepID=A0A1M4UQC9_9GAMM|nr:acetyl-CoA C-acyltransferase [Microbulbifer donghaiensis]SHE58889.1 acetyl-CoA C-acetyltransferase [Microbulbifer donghaiensis]
MRDVAIIGYCRTAIAKALRGAFNQTHGIAMGAHVLKEVVRRAGVAADEIEDVVMGCGLPEGATGHNIARNAGLYAGFGKDMPGVTINRYCGSGLTAASMVANRIAAGEIKTAIAGGLESISLVQFNMNLHHLIYEPLQQEIPAVWWTMIETADYVAKKFGISREAQDEYVVKSQRRVAEALAAGKFAEEIVPMKTTMLVKDRDSGETSEREVTLEQDEGPRPDTTLEGLAGLEPVNAGGTITAGNASQLSDGAAALVMMDAALAAQRGLPILGLFRGMQLSAVAPAEMSIAIAPAVQKLMRHHGLGAGQIDLWELHEAFAVTTLYNQRELETPWETTNVNGGAIALGHPYGMSGVRYLGSTLLELERRMAQRAIIGVCAAGGMATAAFLER